MLWDAGRLNRRLFLLLAIFVLAGFGAAQNPTTTVQDVVFRADGTPAGGVLLISWPAFTTASNQAVAAGTTNVTLGANGALSVNLVPNENVTPASTVYSVTYQLNDGTNKTEFWVVPSSSPATLSQVRVVLGASRSTSQMATEQFVNTAVATKADDSKVVHLGGTETITGTKLFSTAPSLPPPVQPNDAVNKQYVDSSVTNSGSGSYVNKNGDTMTGPLTLPGSPNSANQAATKSYVDIGLSSKADLTSGLVGASELGTGTANNAVCLHGDSTWGGCGGSSGNAVTIQNVPVDPTAPTDGQVLTYVASSGKYLPEAENAVTAGALAQTPTQCNGSFATGIQANGNANCSIADVVELAETAQPNGIPNYGIFWFDSTCHCPKVISNNGQPVQLGLVNVFNSDANTLEEYNGKNPQALRVYGTYSDSADYERIGLGWDSTDNYFVIKSEAAGTGAQRGIGFWTATSMKWAIDAGSVFKPWADNAYDIGSTALRPRDLYVARNLVWQGNTLTGAQGNSGKLFEAGAITGNGLLCVDANGNATTSGCPTSSATWGGITGTLSNQVDLQNALNLKAPLASPVFTGTVTMAAPTFSNVSGTTQCLHVNSSGVVSGTGTDCGTGNGVNAVTSVFGRNGAVVAQNGDYSVSQVTGAALDSSVVHLAGTETIVGSKTFSSDVSVPNLNVSGQINVTSSGPWKIKGGYGALVADGDTTKSTLGFDANGNLALSVEGAPFFNFAPVISPAFSGNPTAPTPAASDNSQSLATTAFVKSQGYLQTVGPYTAVWFTQPQVSTAISFSSTANKALIWGVSLTYPLKTSNVAYYVGTADGSANTYDIGIYSFSGSTGTLVAHIGSTAGTTFAPSTGYKMAAWTGGGNITLQPGNYYLAITSSCTSSCAQLYGGNTGGFTFAGGNLSESVGSGGTLPTTLTVPASYAFAGTTIPALAVY